MRTRETTKDMKRRLYTAGIVAATMLVGANAALAGEVVFDDDDPLKAIGIRSLEIDGTLYDVEFTGFLAPLDVYGAWPGEYTFTTEETAAEAIDAVNAALSDAGAEGIGTEETDPFDFFRIGYESFLFGEAEIRMTRYWKAFTNVDLDWIRGDFPEFDCYLDCNRPWATFTLVEDECTEALDGDLNDDDCTNFDDLLMVLTFWDSAGPEGDGNCDGVVDFSDLLLVLSGWSDEGECK